jgi:cell division control protein 24
VYLEQVDHADPVDSLWSMFRAGTPLLAIYNALQPSEPLAIDQTTSAAANDKKTSKIAVYKFVQACLKDLNIPSEDCFVINDVTGTDTTGFVKVRPESSQ